MDDFVAPTEMEKADASYRDFEFSSEEMVKMLKNQKPDGLIKYGANARYDNAKIFPPWILQDPEWNNSDKKKSKNSLSEIMLIPQNLRSTEQVSTLIHWLMTNWEIANRMGFKRCNQMIKEFKYIVYEPGDRVVTQGEEGYNFYIIVAGDTGVYKDGIGKVGALGSGKTFGELALLGAGEVRGATIKALTKVEVLTLHKSDYDTFVKDIQSLERRENFSLLRSCPLFESWPRHKIDHMAKACRRRIFDDGAVIFHQDDDPDNLYFILEGQVQLVKNIHIVEKNRWPIGRKNAYKSLAKRTVKPYLIATMGRGRYFGEIALLKQQPRSNSATAIGRTVLLALDNLEFLHLLNHTQNGIQESMQKQMQDKRHQAAQLEEHQKSHDRIKHHLSKIPNNDATVDRLHKYREEHPQPKHYDIFAHHEHNLELATKRFADMHNHEEYVTEEVEVEEAVDLQSLMLKCGSQDSFELNQGSSPTLLQRQGTRSLTRQGSRMTLTAPGTLITPGTSPTSSPTLTMGKGSHKKGPSKSLPPIGDNDVIHNKQLNEARTEDIRKRIALVAFVAASNERGDDDNCSLTGSVTNSLVSRVGSLSSLSSMSFIKGNVAAKPATAADAHSHVKHAKPSVVLKPIVHHPHPTAPKKKVKSRHVAITLTPDRHVHAKPKPSTPGPNMPVWHSQRHIRIATSSDKEHPQHPHQPHPTGFGSSKARPINVTKSDPLSHTHAHSPNSAVSTIGFTDMFSPVKPPAKDEEYPDATTCSKAEDDDELEEGECTEHDDYTAPLVQGTKPSEILQKCLNCSDETFGSYSTDSGETDVFDATDYFNKDYRSHIKASGDDLEDDDSIPILQTLAALKKKRQSVQQNRRKTQSMHEKPVYSSFAPPPSSAHRRHGSSVCSADKDNDKDNCLLALGSGPYDGEKISLSDRRKSSLLTKSKLSYRDVMD